MRTNSEQKIFKGYDFMLCQDCLCVRDYTEDRNEGIERCSCGGEFCCCEQCAHVLNLLNCGLLSPELYGDYFQGDPVDLSSWNPETGILKHESQQGSGSSFPKEAF